VRRPRTRSRSSGSSSNPPPTPLDVAARLLTRAPRTEAELEAALVRLGYQPKTAATTVARCCELGWVGDAAYARDRARTLRARGAGSLKIAADLTAHGIDEALIDATVEESLDGERESEWARRALARARVDGPPGRVWRWLASHGFPEDVANEIAGDPD